MLIRLGAANAIIPVGCSVDINAYLCYSTDVDIMVYACKARTGRASE